MSKYSTYKDSGIEWIGEIPEHWDRTKMKYGVNQISERDTPLREDIKISPENVESNTGVCLNLYSDYDGDGMKFTKGDILFNKLRLYLKKILFTEYDGYSLGEMIVLRTKENLNNKYFYYLIFNQGLIDLLDSQSTGIKMPRVSPETIINSNIPIPSTNEQQQIVAFLDYKTEKIDNLIGHKEKKIELLKEKRTALINHVVTKGLNPDVELKDSGIEWIGEIPIHYQMISIKFLVTTPVTDGPHETPVFVDEGIPFLSVNGVVGNKINFNKVRGYISEELHIEYSKKCKPQRDDVLLVKSGSTTGKSTIVETDLDFNIWSPLCIIRSNPNKIIPRFTFQTFQSRYFRVLIEDNWSYGTQPNIGMNVIENLSIVVPPISEQQQIVDYLDKQTKEIDDLIQLEQQKIELLKEYRQSLISEVVTGKVRVCEKDKSGNLGS